jgi:hypothetical protein
VCFNCGDWTTQVADRGELVAALTALQTDLEFTAEE